MPQIKFNKSIINNIFLFCSFIYLVSAINNPVPNTDFSSIKNIIVFLRWIAPYALLPTLLIYLFIIDKNLKFEWIYFFFLIYILGLLIGYLVKPLGFSYHINSQNQIYWLICNSTAFLYFYIIRDKKDFNIFILKIFITLIAIISIKFLTDVYIEFFKEIHNRDRVINFFYNIHSMSPNRLFLEQPVPRSSGLSRMTILLFLFLYIQIYFIKNTKYKTIIFFVITGFLALSIFNLQNRIAVFYIFILFFFTVIFNISDLGFKRKIIYSICIFVIPFLLHLNIQQFTLKIIKFYKGPEVEKKVEIYDEKKKEQLKKEEQIKKKQIEDNKAINRIKNQRLLLKSSTGRKELWSRTVKLFSINKFLGYGIQADRVVLGQNVSSLYFYSMLCGGIISIFSILLITSVLFLKSIKMILFKKIFTSNEIYTCFAILLIGFIYLRSIAEITFGIFGIDMILFFLSFNILRNSKYY